MHISHFYIFSLLLCFKNALAFFVYASFDSSHFNRVLISLCVFICSDLNIFILYANLTIKNNGSEVRLLTMAVRNPLRIYFHSGRHRILGDMTNKIRTMSWKCHVDDSHPSNAQNQYNLRPANMETHNLVGWNFREGSCGAKMDLTCLQNSETLYARTWMRSQAPLAQFISGLKHEICAIRMHINSEQQNSRCTIQTKCARYIVNGLKLKINVMKLLPSSSEHLLFPFHSPSTHVNNHFIACNATTVRKLHVQKKQCGLNAVVIKWIWSSDMLHNLVHSF